MFEAVMKIPSDNIFEAPANTQKITTVHRYVIKLFIESNLSVNKFIVRYPISGLVLRFLLKDARTDELFDMYKDRK